MPTVVLNARETTQPVQETKEPKRMQPTTEESSIDTSSSSTMCISNSTTSGNSTTSSNNTTSSNSTTSSNNTTSSNSTTSSSTTSNTSDSQWTNSSNHLSSFASGQEENRTDEDESKTHQDSMCTFFLYKSETLQQPMPASSHETSRVKFVFGQKSSGPPVLSNQVSSSSNQSSDIYPSPSSSYEYSGPTLMPSVPVQEDGKIKEALSKKLKPSEDNGHHENTENTTKRKGLKSYPMNRDNGFHGYALIINNINIDKRDKRLGAEKDDENLSKSLQTLGYKLFGGTKHRDKTADEIKELIKSVCENTDHSKCDSFVCCLLSHGDYGKIYGTDDRSVYLEDIKRSIVKCQSLAGKPKIFIIQSCRGDRLPNARAVEIDDHDDTPGKILLPEESDLFFGYATTPSTKACRFTDVGSWYVIELCKSFNNHHKELDLLSMVQLAHLEVATNPEYVYEHPVRDSSGKEAVKKYKQSPQMVSTLLRPVYF